jgi:hypothetical protein
LLRLLSCGVSSLLLIRTQLLNSQKWKRKAEFAVEWNHHGPAQYSLLLATEDDAY